MVSLGAARSEEDVTGRLHDALTRDDAPTGAPALCAFVPQVSLGRSPTPPLTLRAAEGFSRGGSYPCREQLFKGGV
jgi:hypothetical protein